MGSENRIKVLLVHEVRLMCNIITSALQEEEQIQIIGCATGVDEALAILNSTPLDVMLVSVRLPEQGAFRLTTAVTEANEEIDVVILGLDEKKERVLRFVEAGASGYIRKNDSLEALVDTIRAAHHGRAYVSPRIAAAMMERLSELAQMFAQVDTGNVEAADLTPREIEVLELIRQNMTNQEIADRLVIEVGTVKNHVHSILQKLNVNTREEAANYLAIIKRG